LWFFCGAWKIFPSPKIKEEEKFRSGEYFFKWPKVIKGRSPQFGEVSSPDNPWEYPLKKGFLKGKRFLKKGPPIHKPPGG